MAFALQKGSQMLVGYVSDEDYVALGGVELEFEHEHGSVAARSRVTGAIHADLEPGPYRVSLGLAGYGAKRVEITVKAGRPYQFRLLSDRMNGFTWPKWVSAGQTSEYCVHSTEAFRLDLWRYGWRKHFVKSFGWCGEHAPRAMAQIIPDGDFSQTGVAWNREGYSLQYQRHAVTAPDESGLYYLHAKTRSGQFQSFPWLVTPATPRAKIAVMASTMTWNAYNSFGGRSNYFNQAGLPDRPVLNARQDVGRYTDADVWPYTQTAAPLSFQRPEPASEIPEDADITDPIQGRTESCFAAGLWRLLGWLDREAFACDLYSDVQLHFGELPLDEYQALVLDNHPEYWSPEMYRLVKAWIFERGGKLLYLGGCGLYAEADLPDERTMLCRREGVYELRQDTPDRLLGVAYTHTGFQTGAPYRVLDEAHWAFAGTGLKNGDRFGGQSLHERCPGGASAHELDKIGPDAPPHVAHLAKGDNPDDAGADLICFDTPSGGGVFSTGSLTWTLSLPIDDNVSTITANVLRRWTDTEEIQQ
ncbi:MAG: carboxypeptidase regulatory-like domain-containing protein [Planctomycetota bacterium]|nr:carboxypeptidase regulatory-like domain-containing protein [Planctomycetota bacterium]